MLLERVALALILILLLVVSIKTCVEDARRRGQSPLLPIALVVVFFPIGPLIWRLFRRPVVLASDRKPSARPDGSRPR